MQQWAQGSEAIFRVDFETQAGGSFEPDAGSVIANINDPDAVQVATGPGVNINPGSYTFTWEVPVDAAVGVYELEWHATHNGLILGGSEFFEVTLPGALLVPDSITLLRSRADDPIPVGGTDADTEFPNDVLQSYLALTGNDMDRATLVVWQIKAARLSHLVDVVESGSERKLSQKARQAKTMLDYWTRIVSDASVLRSKALGGRVVARTASLDDSDPAWMLLQSTPFGDQYVRAYPTYRMVVSAAIL